MLSILEVVVTTITIRKHNTCPFINDASHRNNELGTAGMILGLLVQLQWEIIQNFSLPTLDYSHCRTHRQFQRLDKELLDLPFNNCLVSTCLYDKERQWFPCAQARSDYSSTAPKTSHPCAQCFML